MNKNEQADAHEDELAIRALIDTWLRATRDGDVDTVLGLMTADVVFLVPGQPAMEGRAAFEKELRGMLATHGHDIDAHSEIDEICVAGDMAYSRTRLTVTVTPKDGGKQVKRSGSTLSILRREADDKWRLARDANLLGAPS